MTKTLPLLLSAALTVGNAGAFAPMAQHTATSVTQLQAASGMHSKPDPFGIHETEPVAVKPTTRRERQSMTDVMIDPDYTLVYSIAALCPLIIFYHPSFDGGISLIGLSGGLFHLLFAALLWVQTRRVRMVFEKDSFEFYNIKGNKLDLDNGARLERKPDNYVAGTINRWSYDSVINYGFYPSLEFPVICYFKETETDEAVWNDWFAAFDSYGRGQPHFFPGICNAKQVKEQFEARGIKRKPFPTLKK